MKPRRLPATLRLCLAGVLSFAGVMRAPSATAAPSDEGVPLHLDVRARIERKWEGFRKLPAQPAGKLYYLAQVKETPGGEKLIRPAEVPALAAQLRTELAKRGYQEIGPDQKPEVVLTVTFGRGFLRNPHMEDAMFDELTPGTPTATITSPKQMMRQHLFDAEGRLQKAQEEKLYVNISAWQFPAKAGEKPNLLWRTVVATDNPDTRDLNLAMPAMLAAGADYFDKDTPDGEVTINTTMPTGRVKLGPLEVLPDARPGK